MTRKQEISSERIVMSAFDVLRRDGINGVNARSVAAEIGCSTQPIYQCFENMEQLKEELCKKCAELYEEYCRCEIKSNKYPVYKAYGIAYIRMAREEKEAFRYLFMRDRGGVDSNDISNLMAEVIGEVKNNTGFDEKRAYNFHIEIWIFIHGIASMLATSYLEFDFDTASDMITDVYNALKEKHGRACDGSC